MKFSAKRRRLFWILFLSLVLATSNVLGLSCHECGHMYDGATFMGIQNFDECQFFEHDIAENGNKYLKECPDENEKCCFSLREHMTIEFWGHAAAAEVFVHGCCSSLNQTAHHLTSSAPPPLVTTSIYRAEIMSQTIQNGDIKTRVLFCNTLGCNNQRVPWSEPVMQMSTETREPRAPQELINPSRDPIPRNGRRDDTVESLTPTQNQGRGFVDEDNILALLERNTRIRPKMEEIRPNSDELRPKLEEIRRGQGRAVDIANLLSDLITSESEKEELALEKEEQELQAKENLLRELAAKMGLPASMIPTTTPAPTTTTTIEPTTNQKDLFIMGHMFNQSRFVSPVVGSNGGPVCECQCSCPALICPTFSLPMLRSSACHTPAISLLNIAIASFVVTYLNY